MKSPHIISKSTKFTFCINLFNLITFLTVIITGLILQFEYHMRHLPDDYLVSGLDKSDLMNLHIISAALSLAGIIFHCMLHRKFISAVTNKIFIKKSGFSLSFYLLLIYIPTVLTSIGSWLFFSHGDSVRFVLVEIHDKLALLLIILFVLHIINRFGWVIKTCQKIKTSSA